LDSIQVGYVNFAQSQLVAESSGDCDGIMRITQNAFYGLIILSFAFDGVYYTSVKQVNNRDDSHVF
jgi:hypothetical protein